MFNNQHSYFAKTSCIQHEQWYTYEKCFFYIKGCGRLIFNKIYRNITNNFVSVFSLKRNFHLMEVVKKRNERGTFLRWMYIIHFKIDKITIALKCFWRKNPITNRNNKLFCISIQDYKNIYIISVLTIATPRAESMVERNNSKEL